MYRIKLVEPFIPYSLDAIVAAKNNWRTPGYMFSYTVRVQK